MEAIEIVAHRVVLNDFMDQSGDLACIESASDDPEIVRVTTVPSVYTDVEGRGFIERQRNRRVEHIGWSMAIRDAATLRAVGQIGLWAPELAKGRVEIGYWVAPEQRRRGYAAAALDAVVAWAFAHLDVARVTLSIAPENIASVATARSAGFVREALLHDWEFIEGEPHDLVIFGRFRDSLDRSAPGGTVRRFRHGDRHSVVALWRTVGLVRPQNDPDRDIDRKLASVDNGFFVATERDGDIVGTVMAGYDGHRGWINCLAVAPQARRAGIGRFLMNTAVQHLASLGCPKVNLQVRAGNVEAIEFYESFGCSVDPVISLGLRLSSDGFVPDR